jgi:class 3 adenylate cyclase
MATGQKQPTILVVDGHPFSRAVLTRILEAAHYRVEVADSAGAAVAALEHKRPDAFVLDAEMPGMDGIELCWRLREDPRFRSTPVLIATANEDRYLLRAAFTAGCDDFLVKPLEPLVVVARLGGLLKKAEYFRELEDIRSELGRYVSPRIRNLIERRVASSDEPALMDACILFSDIRGFTAMSQCIEPRALFQTVSTHLGTQVDCVYAHRGYVDKFGGDGLMAIFDGETMATDACQCALDIMERVQAMAGRDDVGPVPLAIGIHTGPVVMGNIGTGDHIDYTAIGESVNIAARLCGQASAADVIVSASVRERVGERCDLRFEQPTRASVRGLSEPIMLYHLRRQGPTDLN